MTTEAPMTADQRLDEMASQIEFLVAEARENRTFKDSIKELTGDLTPLARQTMNSMATALVDAEHKGYFDFARSGVGVVDRVITSFTEEDVEALGDNIVLILETVKEMTQPEVMQMMQSTFHSVQEEVEEGGEPPSMLGLLRQMREPEVRRGLSRMIALLRSMGTDGPQAADTGKEIE